MTNLPMTAYQRSLAPTVCQCGIVVIVTVPEAGATLALDGEAVVLRVAGLDLGTSRCRRRRMAQSALQSPVSVVRCGWRRWVRRCPGRVCHLVRGLVVTVVTVAAVIGVAAREPPGQPQLTLKLPVPVLLLQQRRQQLLLNDSEGFSRTAVRWYARALL